jgi:hypothetical protein
VVKQQATGCTPCDRMNFGSKLGCLGHQQRLCALESSGCSIRITFERLQRGFSGMVHSLAGKDLPESAY